MTFVEFIKFSESLSKSSVVTRDSPYLTTDIFLHAVVKMKFPLLSLVWYLFNVVSGNRFLTRGSKGALVPLVMCLLPDGYYLW